MPRFAAPNLTTNVGWKVWRGDEGLGVVLKNDAAAGSGLDVYLLTVETGDAGSRDHTLHPQDTLILDPPLARRPIFALISATGAVLEVWGR